MVLGPLYVKYSSVYVKYLSVYGKYSDPSSPGTLSWLPCCRFTTAILSATVLMA